jgi:pilus assembly protein CpaF
MLNALSSLHFARRAHRHHRRRRRAAAQAAARGALETRPPNIEGGGAIRQRELLVNALRMRPDRIVVGECRGEEALDMLQAMNTGHDGSMTTLHANTPRDVFRAWR